MSAASADREAERSDGILQKYPVKTLVTIYKDTLVCVDSTGYLVPGADTSGYKFIGVAAEKGANASGQSGDVSVRVWKSGVFKFAKTSAAITDTGVALYISDDQTVAASTTQSIACGYCAEYIDTSTLRVRIDRSVC